MNTGTIAKVSRIERNAQKEVINGIVIQLMNGETIYRQLSQFKVDLSNSGRLLGAKLDTITSVNDIAIAKECAKLRLGSVTGDYAMTVVGAEYEDENPASPTFGKKKKYESAFNRVNGFLDVVPSESQLDREEDSDASALLKAQLKGLFTTVASGNTSGGTDTADAEMSPELMAEIASVASGESATDIVDEGKAAEEATK